MAREENTVIAGGGGGGGHRSRIVLRTSNFVYCAARPSNASNGPAPEYRLGALQGYFLVPSVQWAFLSPGMRCEDCLGNPNGDARSV